MGQSVTPRATLYGRCGRRRPIPTMSSSTALSVTGIQPPSISQERLRCLNGRHARTRPLHRIFSGCRSRASRRVSKQVPTGSNSRAMTEGPGTGSLQDIARSAASRKGPPARLGTAFSRGETLTAVWPLAAWSHPNSTRSTRMGEVGNPQSTRSFISERAVGMTSLLSRVRLRTRQRLNITSCGALNHLA